jgi:hypothetical protein
MAYVLGRGWSAETIISSVIQAVLVAALGVFPGKLYAQIRKRRSAGGSQKTERADDLPE